MHLFDDFCIAHTGLNILLRIQQGFQSLRSLHPCLWLFRPYGTTMQQKSNFLYRTHVILGVPLARQKSYKSFLCDFSCRMAPCNSWRTKNNPCNSWFLFFLKINILQNARYKIRGG